MFPKFFLCTLVSLNLTSWVAFVTPTNRPKSVRDRCVIEVFGGGFVIHFAFWNFILCEGS